VRSGAALTRGEARILVQGLVTKDSDRFLGQDFSTRYSLMQGFRRRSRNISFLLQAADDARGITGFFDGAPGVLGSHGHLGLGRENDALTSTPAILKPRAGSYRSAPYHLACASRPPRRRAEILVNEPGDVNQNNVDACAHYYLE
jgi:hypothetical protein